MPSALIADDEPNLCAELAERLAALWPQLESVAMPRNGGDTLAALNAARPDLAFLDIRMPGIDGLKLASLDTPASVEAISSAPIAARGDSPEKASAAMPGPASRASGSSNCERVWKRPRPAGASRCAAVAS